jgi:heat shock protein HspQ
MSDQGSKRKPLISEAKFAVGQLIHHRLFDYRGVILGIDPGFQGTEAWYRQVAKSQPPKNRPWYHVAVHDATHQTYVAEQNLEPDMIGLPIAHPIVHQVFDEFTQGHYVAPLRWN